MIPIITNLVYHSVYISHIVYKTIQTSTRLGFGLISDREDDFVPDQNNLCSTNTTSL